MKEVIVHEGPRIEIIETAIPEPAADQVLIKVEVAGCNPKDWKTWWVPTPINQGNDIAGQIHSLGQNVAGFKVGDRVMALHELQASHGAHAEYAIAWAATTTHIPDNLTFEEAATIPLAAMTASLALYRTLNLPQPWTPSSTSIPLLIYGGSSAVGAFAIKLANWSNIHPIIAVAGKGCTYVETLLDISKGDLVLDYRSGKTNVINAIRHGAGNSALLNAIDAISNRESIQTVLEAMDDGGKAAVTLPHEEECLREGVEVTLVMSGDVHNTMGKKAGAEDFGHIFMTAFSRGCSTGSFCGHPFEIIDGGIRGMQSAFEALKSGNNSAVKYVVRIGDTEGCA